MYQHHMPTVLMAIPDLRMGQMFLKAGSKSVSTVLGALSVIVYLAERMLQLSVFSWDSHEVVGFN